MISLRIGFKATFTGLCFAIASAAYAQVGSINSAYINPTSLFQPPIPGAVFTASSGGNVQNGTGIVSLNEGNVISPGGNGFANQNVWFFSNNGGASAYNFQGNDYFNASFYLTLGGGTAGKDLEAGFFFANPSGNFGGNLQIIAVGQGGNAGVEFQGGGPSFFLFGPNGTYTLGTTITMGLNYVVDPNNGKNAFQYSLNGVFATSSPGNTYFDLGPGQSVGSPGDTLGGYLQIQTDPNVSNQAGTALFSDINIVAVPEPSSLAVVGVGMVAFLLRRRRI